MSKTYRNQNLEIESFMFTIHIKNKNEIWTNKKIIIIHVSYKSTYKFKNSIILFNLYLAKFK